MFFVYIYKYLKMDSNQLITQVLNEIKELKIKVDNLNTKLYGNEFKYLFLKDKVEENQFMFIRGNIEFNKDQYKILYEIDVDNNLDLIDKLEEKITKINSDHLKIFKKPPQYKKMVDLEPNTKYSIEKVEKVKAKHGETLAVYIEDFVCYLPSKYNMHTTKELEMLNEICPNLYMFYKGQVQINDCFVSDIEFVLGKTKPEKESTKLIQSVRKSKSKLLIFLLNYPEKSFLKLIKKL